MPKDGRQNRAKRGAQNKEGGFDYLEAGFGATRK
jgi:hypothetical protein